MEIKLLRNTTTKRLILVDKRTNVAILSLSPKNFAYVHLIGKYKEEIEEYKPKNI